MRTFLPPSQEKKLLLHFCVLFGAVLPSIAWNVNFEERVAFSHQQHARMLFIKPVCECFLLSYEPIVLLSPKLSNNCTKLHCVIYFDHLTSLLIWCNAIGKNHCNWKQGKAKSYSINLTVWENLLEQDYLVKSDVTPSWLCSKWICRPMYYNCVNKLKFQSEVHGTKIFAGQIPDWKTETILASPWSLVNLLFMPGSAPSTANFTRLAATMHTSTP